MGKVNAFHEALKASNSLHTIDKMVGERMDTWS